MLKMLLCFTCGFLHVVSEVGSSPRQMDSEEKYLSRKSSSVTLLDCGLPK